MRNKEDVVIFGKPGHQKSAVFNVPEGFPQPSDVLVCPHERGNNQQGCNFHNSQKPILLMAHLLMLYTNPGELILDCFAGSGSTLVAAMKLNRRFIGVERDERFYRIACRRLDEVWQRKTARRLTYISLPSNQPNVDSTAPEEESAIPVAPEAENQKFEDTNLAEELQ
jgi:DNA modification methylase